jgi:hypothetical protein
MENRKQTEKQGSRQSEQTACRKQNRQHADQLSRWRTNQEAGILYRIKLNTPTTRVNRRQAAE